MALIRFQSDNNLPPAERRNYKNVFHALSTIYKEDGLKGLWRGSIPTVARAMAVNSSHLVGYNESKEQIMKYLGEKKETMNIRLAASAVSGVAVSIVVLPFDNVKTKILKMKKSKICLMQTPQESFPIKDSLIALLRASKTKGFSDFGWACRLSIQGWHRTP